MGLPFVTRLEALLSAHYFGLFIYGFCLRSSPCVELGDPPNMKV